MKKIPVKFAKIDDEDFEKISKYSWSQTGNYAHTWDGEKNILMHRLIMNCPEEKQVDHINHDGLDNRKENLRICNQTENNMNCRKRKSSSNFKGVTKCSSTGKWRAQITINKKPKNLGRFETELEAAKKYNEVAIYTYGNFAILNEVPNE